MTGSHASSPEHPPGDLPGDVRDALREIMDREQQLDAADDLDQWLPPGKVIDASVVFMTHYIPLYQVRVLQEIARRVRRFRVLLSTPIEPNRDFELDWGKLDVDVQKSWTFRRRWTDRKTGFEDPLFIHLPYDTFGQLRSFSPDVILSMELGARSIAASIYRRFSSRARLVLCTYMSQHTEQSRGSMRSLIRGRLLRQADAVTYNGPSCREYLRQLQVPDDDLFHLPYAADDRNVPACMPTKDDTACRGRLLCVGQLSQRKGVVPMLHSLCEYARKHTDRKLDIVFVGEGSMRDELRNISMPENLTIRMEGIVPAARIPEFAATCGAAIAPTLADEWLLVTNESLHQGLPLIGSRYAQSVETLIRDGVNGWSYDPLQSESLHASLDAYFALDSAAYQTMRETCVRSIAHRTPAWAAAGALQAIGHVLRQRDGEIALTDNATEVNGEP